MGWILVTKGIEFEISDDDSFETHFGTHCTFGSPFAQSLGKIAVFTDTTLQQSDLQTEIWTEHTPTTTLHEDLFEIRKQPAFSAPQGATETSSAKPHPKIQITG